MTGAAKPISFTYKRDSLQNGNITSYNFTVITMNYLKDGDNILIDLPYPVFADQETTKCYGNTRNLMAVLPCKVSTNLSQINLTIKLPSSWRQLSDEQPSNFEELFDEHEDQRSLSQTGQINTGETIEFQITSIKNPFSFIPTDDALQYTVYTDNGFMIEHSDFSDKLRVNNTVEGFLDPLKASALPSDFRQNVLANYTL